MNIYVCTVNHETDHLFLDRTDHEERSGHLDGSRHQFKEVSGYSLEKM